MISQLPRESKVANVRDYTAQEFFKNMVILNVLYMRVAKGRGGAKRAVAPLEICKLKACIIIIEIFI